VGGPRSAASIVHRLLVQRGFLGDAPAQVNRLEPRPVFLAVLAQPGKDLFLQRIPLRDQIAACPEPACGEPVESVEGPTLSDVEGNVELTKTRNVSSRRSTLPPLTGVVNLRH